MAESIFEPDEPSNAERADEIAISESAKMASDTLDADGKEQEHNRHQKPCQLGCIGNSKE